MKKTLFGALLFCLSCGYSDKDVTASGQVKAVSHKTPIVCPERDVVDISLGVMKNGVGSMSTHDMYLVVYDPAALATLKEAAKKSSIVDFTYNDARFRWCNETEELTSVKFSEDK